jgi:phage protein D
VTSTSQNTASTFHATAALGIDPNFPAAFWASQDVIPVEVQMGFLPPGAPEGNANWQTMILGNTDSIEIDPICALLTLSGRDLASLLIDTKTQNAYPNQTASQVAASIAAEHGLQASIVATTTPLGAYYQIDHTQLELNNLHRVTNEWDLLTYLADTEGFDVFVQGNTLFFQPQPTPQTVTPLQVIMTAGPPVSANVLTIKLERNLTLARDIQVTVKTWNSRHNGAFTRIVKGTTGTAPKGSKPVNYVRIRPGLTPDQALQYGQQQLALLSQHERKVTLTMPGEFNMTPQAMVQLSGTNTAFDQVYFVDQVERAMSYADGFTQTGWLKNTSPRSTETVQ